MKDSRTASRTVSTAPDGAAVKDKLFGLVPRGVALLAKGYVQLLVEEADRRTEVKKVCTLTEDGIASPEAYWEGGSAIRTPISSAGPLIVRPHRVLFGDVLDSSHLSRAYERDTDYLNDFYGPTALILPQHVAVMIDEFIPGTPRFHRRGGTLQTYMLVHFNDEWKPMLITSENIIEAYPQSSLVADEFEAWHLLQLQVCLF